jgi:hypothetical protein
MLDTQILSSISGPHRKSDPDYSKSKDVGLYDTDNFRVGHFSIWGNIEDIPTNISICCLPGVSTLNQRWKNSYLNYLAFLLGMNSRCLQVLALFLSCQDELFIRHTDKSTMNPPREKGAQGSTLGPKLPWIRLSTEVATDPTNRSSFSNFKGSSFLCSTGGQNGY